MGVVTKKTAKVRDGAEIVKEKIIYIPRIVNAVNSSYPGQSLSGFFPSSDPPDGVIPEGGYRGNNGAIYDRNGRTTAKGWSLGFMGSPTGCGMGIMYGWTGIPYQNLTDDDWNFLREVVKQRCKASTWNCLITTMGDSYKAYEIILIKIGFVKIHSFHNLNHGTGYQQAIYQLAVSSMP